MFLPGLRCIYITLRRRSLTGTPSGILMMDCASGEEASSPGNVGYLCDLIL